MVGLARFPGRESGSLLQLVYHGISSGVELPYLRHALQGV